MEDLTKYTMEELTARLHLVSAQLDGIKGQLNEAKGRAAAEGDYSDREWFNSAQSALRFRGREHQAIAHEIGRRNREEKRQRANQQEVHFVRIARRRLDPALFQEMWMEAEDARVRALAQAA